MSESDYQWYKAHHICVRCHQQEAAKGQVRCLDCRDKETDIDRERKRKELAKEAPTHRAERLRKMRERRERLKAQGICVYCGKRKVLSGKRHCLECYLKQKRSNCLSKRRRRANDKSRVLSAVNRKSVRAEMRTSAKGGS